VCACVCVRVCVCARARARRVWTAGSWGPARGVTVQQAVPHAAAGHAVHEPAHLCIPGISRGVLQWARATHRTSVARGMAQGRGVDGVGVGARDPHRPREPPHQRATLRTLTPPDAPAAAAAAPRSCSSCCCTLGTSAAQHASVYRPRATRMNVPSCDSTCGRNARHGTRQGLRQRLANGAAQQLQGRTAPAPRGHLRHPAAQTQASTHAQQRALGGVRPVDLGAVCGGDAHDVVGGHGRRHAARLQDAKRGRLERAGLQARLLVLPCVVCCVLWR
jgi:hypothetical protein